MHGFSLIELMIVVVIIGVLAGIGIPAYQDYVIRSQVSAALLEVQGAHVFVEAARPQRLRGCDIKIHQPFRFCKFDFNNDDPDQDGNCAADQHPTRQDVLTCELGLACEKGSQNCNKWGVSKAAEAVTVNENVKGETIRLVRKKGSRWECLAHLPGRYMPTGCAFTANNTVGSAQ